MTEKAQYFTPEVIEHGSLEEMTLGLSGCNVDWFTGRNDDFPGGTCGGGGGGGS